MTAQVASLDAYRKELVGLPAERFIGSLLWFSLSGGREVDLTTGTVTTHPVRTTHALLEQWFKDLDLDEAFLPPKILKVNAFRKASSEVTRKYETSAEGVHATLLVREVTYDGEQVVRHIVKEMRDSRQQKLKYEPHLATLKFFRARRTAAGRAANSEDWRWQILNTVAPEDLPHVESMIAEIQGRYDDLAVYLHHQAIRGMIRDYLTSLNAIAVKPQGGVYFIHQSRQDTVDALQQLVERIGPNCSFHQVPLLDTPRQRAMLTDAFQDEVEQDVKLLLKDVLDLNEKVKNGKGKVTPEKYADLNARLQDVMSRSTEYTRVLGLAQGRAGDALELGIIAVSELAGRIVVK